MASTIPPSLDFAKLLPVNLAAKEAYATAVAYIRETSHASHLKYYNTMPGAEVGSAVISSDEAISDAENTAAIPIAIPDIDSGYYALSLSTQAKPLQPVQGWRGGRGVKSYEKHKEIEFLLLPPTNAGRVFMANVAFFFRFHPGSGMLMIHAGHLKKPVECDVDGQWISMSYPDSRVLFKRSNKIRVYKYEYELIFTVPSIPAQQQELLRVRDQWIKDATGAASPPRLQVWPFSTSFRRVNDILVCNSHAFGAFGWVYEGVDCITGESIAVKELSIKSSHELTMAFKEAEVGRSFRGVPGLLSTDQLICEHGFAGPCGRFPEKAFLSHPLGLNDFTTLLWHTIYESLDHLRLLQSTLIGLQAIHDRGMIHRDISRKNMLIMSLNPPSAVICDYGKLTSAPTSNDTRIGPIPSLAPEVWKQSYNSKIDIWAWAYAVVEIFDYKALNTHITENRHLQIQKHLQAFSVRFPQTEGLMNLLSQMLDLNPQSRPSAQVVLQYRCWHVLKTRPDNVELGDQRSSSPGSGGKPPKQAKYRS